MTQPLIPFFTVKNWQSFQKKIYIHTPSIPQSRQKREIDKLIKSALPNSGIVWRILWVEGKFVSVKQRQSFCTGKKNGGSFLIKIAHRKKKTEY